MTVLSAGLEEEKDGPGSGLLVSVTSGFRFHNYVQPFFSYSD
jgi:hypothetical protein